MNVLRCLRRVSCHGRSALALRIGAFAFVASSFAACASDPEPAAPKPGTSNWLDAGDDDDVEGDAGPDDPVGSTSCEDVTECPAPRSPCVVVACTAGRCAEKPRAAGPAPEGQIVGDYRRVECDGAGKATSVADDADVPDDDEDCTDDRCSGGLPSHANKPAGTACGMGSDTVCSPGGTCVGCAAAADCGSSDACKTRTCQGNVCGVTHTAAGTAIALQTPGDCKENRCDGKGGVEAKPYDADVPADDGNACTSEICSAGVAAHPPRAVGSACNQNGGSYCNASAMCVAPTCTDGIKNGSETGVDCGGACPACPPPVAVNPADGSKTGLATGPVVFTFAEAMKASTLTGQGAPGACSGSLQISRDGFATCLGLVVAVDAAGKVATGTPVPALSYGTTYEARVTTAAQNADGVALDGYVTPNGFTTAGDADCADSQLVISQVYGAGGNAGAAYKNDFIEIHNRSALPVSVAGMSVQYASAGSSFNVKTDLGGTIPAGGYLLVQGAGGANGADLPAPDVVGAMNLAATEGKVALVNGTTLLGASCKAASVVDLVGYGAGATCNDVTLVPAPAPSTVNAVTRAKSGCQDSGDDGKDFAAAAVAPRNAASAKSVCSCVVNDSGAPAEVGYCNVQSPTSLALKPGAISPVVYGRVYVNGYTEAAGAHPLVVGQLGFGPANMNPQNQSGWVWTNASWNIQVGSNDEYRSTFVAPATGNYRYAFRFSADGGQKFTICDLDGAGKNPTLSFDWAKLPVLTVAP